MRTHAAARYTLKKDPQAGRCLQLNRCSAESGSARRLRLRSWDHGLAAEVYDESNGWVPTDEDPGVPILPAADDRVVHMESGFLQPAAASAEPQQLSDFISRIPQPLADLAGSFVWLQISALQLFHRSPEAVELARSNPCLFMLLIDSLYAGGIPKARWPACARKKRTEILSDAAGRSSRRLVNFLGRVTIRYYRKPHMALLRRCIDNAVLVDSLQQVKNIPEYVLLSVSRVPEPVIRMPLFARSCESFQKNPFTAHRRLRRAVCYDELCRGYAARMGITDCEQRLRGCKTLEQIARIHDRMKEKIDLADDCCTMAELRGEPVPDKTRLYAMRHKELRDLHDRLSPPPVNMPCDADSLIKQYGPDFPEPPLPGSSSIQPITTVKGLFAESEQMCHCVWCYCSRIMSGQVYIYSARCPERATVEVIIGKSSLELGEIKARNDRKPSADTMAAVQEWFSSKPAC